jgi:streptomycin 6-kinase
MERRLVPVPESFQAFGRWQREGPAGRLWLANLPQTVADYCDRWGLQVDGEPMHGSNGLAVPVHRDDEPLVLKVDWPDQDVVEQARALVVWNGRGMVRLDRSDPSAGVLLLERLDPGQTARDLPLREAVPLAGRVLRRLAIPAPDGFRATWDEAQDCRASFRAKWEAVGRPFSGHLLDTALGLADDMAAERPDAGQSPFMVNRDLHYDQILRGTREPWLTIDPLPMVGDIEFQVGQLLWTRYNEMAASGTLLWCFDALVDAAGLDERRAYSWLVLRCVSYWLWGLGAGFTKDPLRCRHILEELGCLG